MKTKNFFKITMASLCVASMGTFVSCDNDDNGGTQAVTGSKYTVSTTITSGDDTSSYFVNTDDLVSGSISIIGNGYEGYANLAASIDGFFYDINDVETTIDKYQFTDAGLVKVDAISYNVLPDGVTIRYIEPTGTGDLWLSGKPAGGEVPYMIIDLEEFTLEAHGSLILPQYDGYTAGWSSPVVSDGKIYFGTAYSTWKTSIADELVTVKYDYPSLTNEEIITSSKSKGSTAGYRGKGSFVTENGDIYQFNLNSSQWFGVEVSEDDSAVIVKITDGEYDDDFVIDVSAEYDETISIWNAWYVGDDIVYAAVIKESDLTEWGDLSANVAKLVEINLSTGSVNELTIPSAPLANVFKLESVDGDKFYIPININGGASNIYEITIGGGSNGYQTGAVLDGSNAYVQAIYTNF